MMYLGIPTELLSDPQKCNRGGALISILGSVNQLLNISSTAVLVPQEAQASGSDNSGIHFLVMVSKHAGWIRLSHVWPGLHEELCSIGEIGEAAL